MAVMDGGFASMIDDPQTVRLNVSGETLIKGDYVSDVYVTKDGTTTKSEVPQTGVAVTSYQFFTGGLHCYMPGNHRVTDHHPDGKEITYTASYAKEAMAAQDAIEAGNEPVVPEGTTLYVSNYNRKKIDGVVGIAIHYVSTGGNEKYSINVCDEDDLGPISEVL